MYKQLKNDGFTLVEIIVSLAIGSVVLALVLSMITTAFSDFGSASRTQLKKSSLDGVVSYVRERVLNAGDVVVSTKKPSGDDWKWLYVSKGMLYKGSKSGESKVFDPSYYNKKDDNDTSSSAGTLQMNVTMNHDYVSKDDNHVYSGQFSYKLSDSQEKFTRNDKAVFSNITGTTSSYDGDIQNISENKNEEYNLNTDSTGLKLYYKKASGANSDDSKNNDNKETGDYTGTVADKIKAMTPEVNRGYFVGTVDNVSTYGYYSDGITNYLNTPAHNTYRLGDYVYYQGYWYMLVKNVDPTHNGPGNGSDVWQKLTEDYTTNNPYVKGDVVKYNDAYYRVAVDYLSSGDIPAEWNTKDWPNKTYEPHDIRFEYIGTKPDSTKPGYDTNWNDIHDKNGEIKTLLNGGRSIPDKSPFKIRQKLLNGVSTYATNFDQFSNVTKFTADQIDAGKFKPDQFNTNDLVAIEVKNSGKNRSNNDSDAPYYRLYQKIFDPVESLTKEKKIPGNSSLSGWRLLENSYCPGSSYASGDVLRLGTTALNDDDTTNYIQLNKSSDIHSALGQSSFTFTAYSSLFGYRFINQTINVDDNGSLNTLLYFSLYLNLINNNDYWIACSSFGIELTDLRGNNRDTNFTTLETAMIHKVGMDDEKSTGYGDALWKCGKALWKEMSYNEALKAS